MHNIMLAQSSLTDWVQAIGACIAAIGLVVTLILQWKATKAQVVATNDQLELTKHSMLLARRDHRRFLKEIMPKLNYTVKSFAPGSYSVRFQAADNAVINLKIVNEKPDECSIEQYTDAYNIEVGGEFGFMVSVPGIFQSEHQIFSFAFEDEIGTKYCQTFSVDIDQDIQHPGVVYFVDTEMYKLVK